MIDQSVPKARYWVLESKYFDTEYQVHSLHRFRESAVSMGIEVFDSFPFDREGDGVRLRRGTIDSRGLTIDSNVLWARYCENKTLAEWMAYKDEPVDDEDDSEL